MVASRWDKAKETSGSPGSFHLCKKIPFLSQLQHKYGDCLFVYRQSLLNCHNWHHQVHCSLFCLWKAVLFLERRWKNTWKTPEGTAFWRQFNFPKVQEMLFRKYSLRRWLWKGGSKGSKEVQKMKGWFIEIGEKGAGQINAGWHFLGLHRHFGLMQQCKGRLETHMQKAFTGEAEVPGVTPDTKCERLVGRNGREGS